LSSKSLPIPLNRAYLILVDLRVVGTFYLALIMAAAASIVRSNTKLSGFEIASAILAGFLTVNLLEYLIHRYLFHPTKYGNRYKKLILSIHARHHRFNNVEEYAIVPITTSFMLIATSVLIFQKLSGATHALTMAYFIACGLSYTYHEYLHYMIHQSKLAGRIGAFYTRYHDVHHLQDANKNYCFISPFWDIVFRSYQWPR
jgi:sterol desaturase/sphingolipid hydroxylase (fatty acid hydroxylase superfamily)